MRVVAGVARGRILRAPAGDRTRPTSDRVREAMFSMLTSMDVVRGAAVVDLFAGSGALGIEALSRGAGRVTFVDIDAGARRVIEANLAVVSGVSAGHEVIGADAVRFVRGMPQADVVLADPPYGYDRWAELLEALEGHAELLVAETAEALDPGPEWETVKVKRYGGTVLTVMQPPRSARDGSRPDLDAQLPEKV